MASRNKAANRGARSANRELREIGVAVRDARVAGGLSQSTVARAARTSQTQMSRLERGVNPRVTIGIISWVLAVLGMRLSMKAYPEGSPLRDAGHAALLQKLRRQVPDHVKWRFEVPVTRDPGGLRAWDAELTLEIPTRGEAELRLRDLQALQRRMELKQRDGTPGRLILVIAGSHANRRILREEGAALRLAVPLQTADVTAALRKGPDPGANGIVVL